MKEWHRMSDPNEDRAYEMGDPTRSRYLQPDEEEEPVERPPIIIHEFRNWERRPLLTEDDIVYHAPSIYQGPLKESGVTVPWWTVALFLAVFVAGVGGLLWALS